MPTIRRDVDATADSYPYVTGMGFRNRCHLVFDEFLREGPDNITEDGQVAFVKIDFIPEFFSAIVPRLKKKVKIVTHNGALGVNAGYKRFLDNPKVELWYAQNANFYHEKLTSVPLGLPNKRWVHGDPTQIKFVNDEGSSRDYLLYMNFDIGTNVSERTKVFNMFNGEDYVYSPERKPFREYLRDLRKSKYVLSPPGAGIDCHRIWESIALGAIPIVQRCHNISFYKDMPILIIDDWTEVNEESLEEKWPIFTSQDYSDEMMYMDYWVSEIELLDTPRHLPAGLLIPPGSKIQ